MFHAVLNTGLKVETVTLSPEDDETKLQSLSVYYLVQTRPEEQHFDMPHGQSEEQRISTFHSDTSKSISRNFWRILFRVIVVQSVTELHLLLIQSVLYYVVRMCSDVE